MMLNGILKGDYQELLDVIAYEIPWPPFARQKPPLPRDLSPLPRSQAAAGEWSRSGGRIRYIKLGGRLLDHGRSLQPDCCCSYRAGQL